MGNALAIGDKRYSGIVWRTKENQTRDGERLRAEQQNTQNAMGNALAICDERYSGIVWRTKEHQNDLPVTISGSGSGQGRKRSRITLLGRFLAVEAARVQNVPE